MLFMVWVGACVPFTCVMGVVVGASGWWVFQCCVAVVWASRRVPGVGVCVSWLVPGACLGVVWLVSGVGGLVWARFGVGWLVSGVSGVCAGVVWLVLVGVCWLVCVVWFRMLTCLASFFLLVLSFVLSCCLVNNGLPGCVGAGGCLGWCGCVLCVFWGWLVVGCVFLCLWAGGCVLWAGESVFVCFLWVIGLLLVCWSRVVCVWGYWLLSLLVRECECWCLVVSVVVWVWGVLLLVAFCLCGFVTRLLRVV